MQVNDLRGFFRDYQNRNSARTQRLCRSLRHLRVDCGQRGSNGLEFGSSTRGRVQGPVAGMPKPRPWERSPGQSRASEGMLQLRRRQRENGLNRPSLTDDFSSTWRAAFSRQEQPSTDDGLGPTGHHSIRELQSGHLFLRDIRGKWHRLPCDGQNSLPAWWPKEDNQSSFIRRPAPRVGSASRQISLSDTARCQNSVVRHNCATRTRRSCNAPVGQAEQSMPAGSAVHARTTSLWCKLRWHWYNES